MDNRYTIIGLYLVLCLMACGTSAQTPAQRAQSATEALNAWYSTSAGQWQTTGWWNSANALTATIQYAMRTGSRSFDSIISNTYSKHSGSSFLNDYYDDEGWWGLAWIEAYKYNKNADYLKMAGTIFADIQKSWDTKCNGGVWWDKKHTYKNAIPNELAFQLASALYIQTQQAQYLTFSNNIWNWFQQSGMINGQHLINDGLTTDCKNNGQTPWTYNQGVILGALVNMYNITKNSSYINEATAIADAAIGALVTSHGILREPCEPNCGGDGPQFKGVFMRNLGYLYQQTKNQKYSAFITNNANSIWNSARSGSHLGLIWAEIGRAHV